MTTLRNLLTRDSFSYAEPTAPLRQVALIKTVERIGGQPKLKAIYEKYRADAGVGNVAPFWNEVVERLDLNLDIQGRVPRKLDGPTIFIANHPYGVLDGIVLCWIASQSRPNFKILIHQALCRIPEMADHVLPIDFSGTRDAQKVNLASRAAAREHLAEGGSLLVFPAGAISTTPKFLSRKAVDWDWQPLAARLIRQTKADVVPVFFAGQNSQLFQYASHISQTLRYALIFHEVFRRVGTKFEASIGDVIPYTSLASYETTEQLTAFLHQSILDLNQNYH